MRGDSDNRYFVFCFQTLIRFVSGPEDDDYDF